MPLFYSWKHFQLTDQLLTGVPVSPLAPLGPSLPGLPCKIKINTIYKLRD